MMLFSPTRQVKANENVSTARASRTSTKSVRLHADGSRYVQRTWEITASQQTTSMKLFPFAEHVRVKPELGDALLGYCIVTIHDLQGDSAHNDSLSIPPSASDALLFR